MFSSYTASEVYAMPVWDFYRLMYACEERAEKQKAEAERLKAKNRK